MPRVLESRGALQDDPHQDLGNQPETLRTGSREAGEPGHARSALAGADRTG